MSWYGQRGALNEYFATQVRLIRADFRLQKHSSTKGLDVSTDFWRKMWLTNAGDDAYVNIERVDWLSWTQGSGDVSFTFKVHMADHVAGGRLQRVFDGRRESQVNLRILRDWEFKMRFPSDFPQSAPAFYMNDRRFVSQVNSFHDHHVLSGAQLCLFGGSNDWIPSRDTALSGLYSALDLLLWHYKKFGW